MELPIQLTFHNLNATPDIEERIKKEAASLDSYYDKIMACRVLVDVPHKHHKQGNLYHLRIDVTVPGGEIVVKHEPNLHSSRKELRIGKNEKASEAHTIRKSLKSAINEAFDTTKRLLQDYARKQRGDTKIHQSPERARISKFFRKKGYGYLKTPNGRKIYFESSRVQAPIHEIKTGSHVVFLEEDSLKGPTASVVWML